MIDLTGDEPVPPPRPRDGDLQIVSSTVQRAARAPTRGVKRPRGALAPPLSPVKQRLLQNLLAPPPPPPPEPEPEGPKCGICMEPMGGSHERAMASGNCGHVYCYDCLVEAVRAQVRTRAGSGARSRFWALHWVRGYRAADLPPTTPGRFGDGRGAESSHSRPTLRPPAPPLAAPQKKCPTCRKNMQLRQIHKVFLQFS